MDDFQISRKQLTDEQRARITQNFKAAKAIRDRKRSHLTSPVPSPSSSWPSRPGPARLSLDGCSNSGTEFRSPLMKKTHYILNSGGLQRKALSELKPNTYFGFATPQGLRRIDKELVQEDQNSHDDRRLPEGSFKVKHLVQTSISEIPGTTPEHIVQLKEWTGQVAIPDVYLDDFDDEILQEIDVLCGRKSKYCEKAGNPLLTSSKSVEDENAAVMCQPASVETPAVCGAVGFLKPTPGFVPNVVEGRKESNMEHNPLHISKTCAAITVIANQFEDDLRADQNPCNAIKSNVGESPLLKLEDLCPANDGIVSPATSNVALDADGKIETESGSGSGWLNREESAATTSGVNPSMSSEVVIYQDVPAYLENLNKSQREAATSNTMKPLLILAGPGSGKTSTMVARLLHLLHEGIQPTNILAMTFTTAAATEMRERVGGAVGKALSKELAISTFHSFCLQLCRTHCEKLGRTSEFLVYGPSQQRKAVVEATRIALSESNAVPATEVDGSKGITSKSGDSVNPSLWKDQARKWQQFVTQAKCAGKTPEDYEKVGNILGSAVLRNYEKTLATCNALDYHDFISFSVSLLRDHHEVLDHCQKTWSCILVDEFQDTSAMQYSFLQLLASHQRITIVGDDDQSIFGFNGANSTGFDSFRTDFPDHREVRLHQNYRSTRSIVEAASTLIRNNLKRCQTKQVFTDNILGEKIEVRECRNESSQCAFVVDSILTNLSSSGNLAYGSTAILYRRQVTGKLFQSTFRARKIPFNVHGVAFYRKKVIKNIIALLWTALPGHKDRFVQRVFKALFGGDKTETKKVVDYVEKISRGRKCEFSHAASEIFTAKVSGTFTRRQLALGKKVLSSIKTVNHLVAKEKSLSAVITAVANLLPQRPNFDKRAVVTEDGRRLLNEDEDPRTVLEFLLDDVDDFLRNHFNPDSGQAGVDGTESGGGCSIVLKVFLDHLAAREEENFLCRREENKNSVTLTTMHQSKGLEWDTVFIVKANDTETPLLHEGMGCVDEGSISLEEERRLFYVAMTRARKKLYISYIAVDSQRQILQPSRFLKELPRHLLDFQVKIVDGPPLPSVENPSIIGPELFPNLGKPVESDLGQESGKNIPVVGLNVGKEADGSAGCQHRLGAANAFLKGFSIESRSVVAALFHSWAKKACFQDPHRLLSKVGFVIDERLRSKSTKNREVLINLKCALRDEAALPYAQNVLAWEKLPTEERAILQAERQEHFQHQNSERSLASSSATPKQVLYLRSLGCTMDPTSRLHASRLIEQYKKL